MSYVGRILWSYFAAGQNPKPYLCIFEYPDRYEVGWGDSSAKGYITSLDIVDLEYGEVLTILESDINELIHRGEVNWDDQ